MPPLRRYLRLTQHSCIEVRIYLDNPADLTRWLLHASSPALPRVIEVVRPLVLPKLREENANNPKAKKKKGWKDVVVTDEFDVSVFLTETSTRHSILHKSKVAKSESGSNLGTTDGKMTGMTRDAPVEISGEEPSRLLREDTDTTSNDRLRKIPPAKGESQDGEEQLLVSDDDEEGSIVKAKGKGRQGQGADTRGDGDDKKKLGLKTFYDGFCIYGRILCLVVTRKGGKKGKETATSGGGGGSGGGHAMMEDWIASTQVEGGMMDG